VISRVSVSLIMCTGGEYRGVRHDRAFQRPFASAFAFNPRASPQSCRAEDPEQATFQRVYDLANRGLRGAIPSSGGPLDKRRAFCAIVGTTGGHMAKTRISSTDLAWIFQEKLNAFDSCPPAVSIAIVPNGEDGWAAVTTARVRAAYPLCARRIEQIQKQLRGIYVLAKD
jgi:hypothetical protein